LLFILKERRFHVSLYQRVLKKQLFQLLYISVALNAVIFFILTFIMFATSQACQISVCLPNDRMMKNFIFAFEDRTDLQSKPQHLCVKIISFICSTLNERVSVVQNMLEGVFRVSDTAPKLSGPPRKEYWMLWNYRGTYYIWNVLLFWIFISKTEHFSMRYSYCLFIEKLDCGFPSSELWRRSA
jgi:hypothetical protein